jgi:hypothetical protein
VAGWVAWQQGLTHISVPAIGVMKRRDMPELWKTPDLWNVGPAWAMFLDQWHATLVVGGIAVLVALACMKIISPRLRRLVIRQKLTALPAERVAEVLLPLRQDRSRDTRQLATAIARDLGLPTELSPAPAPDAHGDEASPAERFD